MHSGTNRDRDRAARAVGGDEGSPVGRRGRRDDGPGRESVETRESDATPPSGSDAASRGTAVVPAGTPVPDGGTVVERDLQEVLGRITDAFISLDRDWTVTYINEQGAEFLGTTRTELLGKHFWEQFPEGEDGPFHESYRRALEEQEPTTITERSLANPDRWLEARAYPTESGLSVYVRDVTERKEMEAALRDRSRKIEALHGVAADLASCEEEATAYDLTVAAAQDILAFDICYVATVADDEIRPQAANVPELAERSVVMSVEEGAVGKAVRTGETYVVEDATADPYAEPVEEEYVSALAVPVEDVGVFQAVSTVPDSFSKTDRELGELLAANLAATVKRIRSASAVRESRDRFAALFAQIPDPAVHYTVVEGDLVAEAVNAAFVEVFGRSPEAVEGAPLDWLFPDGPTGAPEREGIEGEPDGETEVERVTESGPRPFLVRIAPIPGATERSAYAIYTDISELKRRERELARQNERLERFASVLSHDLRSPLNVAQGSLELLAEKYDDPGLDRAIEAQARMADIIEDVLTLAREGAAVQEPEPVAVEEIAERAWATVHTGEATLDISVESVVADPDRLARLLENLFRNAVEHAGPAVTVTVEATDDGFAVEDDGPGIPAESRRRVFDSGFTTDDRGTGFGLAIVEEIAEAHGWTVTATEGEAGGARFEFAGVSHG